MAPLLLIRFPEFVKDVETPEVVESAEEAAVETPEVVELVPHQLQVRAMRQALHLAAEISVAASERPALAASGEPAAAALLVLAPAVSAVSMVQHLQQRMVMLADAAGQTHPLKQLSARCAVAPALPSNSPWSEPPEQILSMAAAAKGRPAAAKQPKRTIQVPKVPVASQENLPSSNGVRYRSWKAV